MHNYCLLLLLQVALSALGKVSSVPLKPGGADIPVTNENRKGWFLIK